MIGDDGFKITTTVAVDPAAAFRVFTEDIDSWWRRGPAFRGTMNRDGELRFESDGDRRLVEIDGEGVVYEIGRVLVWEPGRRLSFEWRNRNFEPGQVTEVEIWFESSPGGTRVTLEHRGWDSLPDGHPARHGLDSAGVARMMGKWWADVLTGLRRYA